MVTLRVTAADDRSPLVVHRRGLSLADQVALGAAAARVGLLHAGVGYAALHPNRVVALFAGLGWDPDLDAESEQALAGPWARAEAAMSGAAAPPPGDDLVRAVGCVPYAYQDVGARRLADAPGGLVLADAPGLGKTLQVLLALPSGAAVNVACPRNAVPTWEDEVAKWRRDLRVRTLKSRRSATPAQPGEVVVGTLESLPAYEPGLGLIAPGSYLVCDEAHALKGESGQAQRFRTWSDAVRSARGMVWLLTGTPVLNADPEELWRLLDACGRAHDTLGPVDSLRGLFGHKVEIVWVPRRRRGSGKAVRAEVAADAVDLTSITAESVAALQAATCEQVESVTWTGEHLPWVDDALSRAVVRRTKDHVAKDMPSLTRQDVRVQVPRDVLRELARADAGRRLDAQLDALERALDDDARAEEIDRLASQPALATARRLLAGAKLAAAVDLLGALELAGEPTLLFGAHIEPVVTIGSRPGWATITGDITGERRGRIRSEFQAGTWLTAVGGGSAIGGPARGVAMTIRAASESLTLTRAAHVVFLDLDWVPARNEQAECRAHRIGQTRPVSVLRVVADHPVDRRIAAMLTHKERFGRALLAGIENR